MPEAEVKFIETNSLQPFCNELSIVPMKSTVFPRKVMLLIGNMLNSLKGGCWSLCCEICPFCLVLLKWDSCMLRDHFGESVERSTNIENDP